MTSVATSTTAHRPIVGSGFHRAMALLSAWIIFGIHIDGWAHTHVDETLETFFTPWHGIFYAGFTAAAGYLFVSLLRFRAQGFPLQSALPVGYKRSLIGAAIFGLSGGGDFIWHSVFGIEVTIQALLSPTHLGLTLGGGLIVTGTIRAYGLRSDSEAQDGWAAQWPLILSLTSILSIVTFMTQFGQIISRPWPGETFNPGNPNDFQTQALGVLSIMLYTASLMGVLLLAIRRWRLPFGSLTFITTINAISIASQRDQYLLVPAALLTGLLADIFLMQLKPSTERPVAFRIFALLIPPILNGLIILTLALTEGIWWTIHLWTGVLVQTSLLGLLLSLLVFPPPSLTPSQ